MRFGLPEDIITKLNEVFEVNAKVDKALIFGSRAKGNYRSDSDIDIAIKGADITLDDILKMQVEFEEKGIKYKIDLVDYHTVKEEALIEHVDRVGIEMYRRLKVYKLGELAKKITSGGTPSTKNAEYYDGNIPWLNTKEINFNRIWRTEKYISEKGLKNSSAKWIEENSIIVAMYGATAAKVAINKIPLTTNQACCNLTIDQKKADYEFVFYYIWSKYEELENIAVGAAQQNLSVGVIADFPIQLPPLSEQTAIAEVLSSLDNKIDLLHRQNKTLEQLAETLFRKWFVVEADESWEEDVLENYISFDPREKIDRNKAYQFFEMKCLSNVDMNISDGVYRIVSSASSFRNFDTLLAKITPCLENGKTGFVMHLGDDEVARGSTEFIVMRSKGLVSPYWIYCLARDSDFREKAIQSMTGTSGRQRVQIDLLKNITVKVDAERMKKFHDTVSPFFLKIKSNQTQIKTLTKLRDALLPKLVNGEVRVQMN